MGIASAFFLHIGAVYGAAKINIGILNMGIRKSEIILKSVIQIIMASILGIYELIVVVILNQNVKVADIYLFNDWKHLQVVYAVDYHY